MQIFNIYCDESCHLENDRQNVMVLGAVWVPLEKTKQISNRIREIIKRHAIDNNFEIKWTKVSPARIQFYMDLIDYFFDDDDIHFRALIVPDKTKLRHEEFKQSHDDFYYKMYFDMLKIIISPDASYRIYIDIKDTNSAQKAAKLHEVLCNNRYDFSRSIIEKLQTVRSHEIKLMQLADLLIGAISYTNRALQTSEAKKMIIRRISERSGYRLTQSTLYREEKVNLFRWHAS